MAVVGRFIAKFMVERASSGSAVRVGGLGRSAGGSAGTGSKEGVTRS